MNTRLVIIFHGIGERPGWAGQDEEEYWCNEKTFISVLDSIPEISSQMQVAIELTFDDGNATDFTLAAPALRKRGLTGSFFVCAGRIGAPGYLDKYQLRSLAAAGMSIGSHGWDHVDWRSLRQKDAFEREVLQARDCIEDIVAAGPIKSVAIPFGSYDRRVWKAVTKAFTEVYTSDGGLATFTSDSIPRECYTTSWDATALRALAAPRPLPSKMRRSLAMAYKRHRGPPKAAWWRPGS